MRVLCWLGRHKWHRLKWSERLDCRECRRCLRFEVWSYSWWRPAPRSDFEPFGITEPINGGRCVSQHQVGGSHYGNTYTGGRWVQCAKEPGHAGKHRWGKDNQVTPAEPFA